MQLKHLNPPKRHLLSLRRSVTGHIKPNWKVLYAFLVVLFIVLSSIMVFTDTTNARRMIDNSLANIGNAQVNSTSNIIGSNYHGPRILIPAASDSFSAVGGHEFNGTMSVLVTLGFSNQSELSSLLASLSSKNSQQYHKYLTKTQFDSEFSPSAALYKETVGYFSSFPLVKVLTYNDRLSVQLTGPASEIGKIFNTSIVASTQGHYAAASRPTLPYAIGMFVTSVSGLSSNAVVMESSQFGMTPAKTSALPTINSNSYPSPLLNGNTQEIYASDMQVAYNEQSLLNITYPTGEVVATILWSGQDVNGTNVGPFYPSDIYSYFNATLPSYEPHSKVYGVPINGAPTPGVSSTYDVTGASMENTLDLEMMGSTAPGSSIFNVYGPNATYESLDAAFAYILNPNSTFSALNNVSVISNSWGGSDYNNTAWYEYLQEAQVRGISVLASSGDSGDNSNSSKYSGSQVEFPSTMAYNDFGVTAVGGTTVTLTSTLHLQNQIAWYISSADVSDGGPAGSTGGISAVFPEPSWQLNSEANNVINGQGRGVPDIAAIANNTVVYESSNGIGPYILYDWGTSVASPITAGLIAEIDAVLNHYNNSNLGFLNPTLYDLGNQQATSMVNTTTTGYLLTGQYTSTLPALPFYDVKSGADHVYNATAGYDLVTGWGSIDAYNFTIFVLNMNHSNSSYALDGVRNMFNLSGLNVTSYIYDPLNNTYYVNTYYNASIQQNMFVADALGAPIYWIQNVIYINGSQQTGWTMNYSGWVVYPFYGLYPDQTVYEYNFPLGQMVSLPHEFTISTWLSDLNTQDGQMINFQVNSQVLQLPVPGASFIIGSHNYTYSWQGATYYNGPYPDNPYLGGLDPQFGLIGGPSDGLGVFSTPTLGNMSAYIRLMGDNNYITADTSAYNYSIDQTGETAQNLQWTKTTSGAWDMSILNGSSQQGVVSFVPELYNVSFTEYGLPSGTEWSVTLSNGDMLSTTSSTINATEANGTYSVEASSVPGYDPYPSIFKYSVSGSAYPLPITFTSVSNESQIKALSSIDVSNGKLYGGFLFNLTSRNRFSEPMGMSIDNALNELFVPDIYTGVVQAYSLGNNELIGSTHLGNNSEPYGTFFDPFTGYLYVISMSGNLTAINPSGLTVLYNISIPEGTLYPAAISSSANGQTLVVLSSYGNLLLYDAQSGNLLKNIIITGPDQDTGFTGEPQFTIYQDKAYVVNTSDNQVIVANLSDGSLVDVNLPTGYNAKTIVPYGNTTYMLIGNETVSNVLLNASTFQISPGPAVNGMVLSETTDFYSNTAYLMVYNSSTPLGYVIAVSTSYNSVESEIPGLYVSYSMLFSAQEQRIYASASVFNMVGIYSVPQYFEVNFTEQNLPKSADWFVNISGEPTSGSISVQSYHTYLPNGDYSYSIGSTNKTWYAEGGAFTVSNGNVAISVSFSEKTYEVTFTESGLARGTTWYLNLTGGSSYSSSGATLSFYVTNQSYSYSLASANKDYFAPGGSFTVSGTAVTGNAVFKEFLNKINFVESGLPTGTTWYVNMSNGQHISSIGTNQSFMELNGTYTFTLTNLSAYYATSNTKIVRVDGSNVTVTATYLKWAHINGSVSPHNALISVDGVTYSASSSGTFNISVTQGGHRIMVSESGYSTYYGNVTLSPGQTSNLTVHLEKIATPASNSNTLIYVVGGIVAAVAAVSALMFIRRGRK